MNTVLTKAIAFLIMIALGTVSVRSGLLKREDGQVLRRIIMNFTLPCALVAGFGNVEFSFWMAAAILFGILMNLLAMSAARFLFSGRCTPHETANNMLCTGTYNIGNFAFPFCQSFLPEASLAYLITFDLGNSIMTLGGAAALAQNVIEKGAKFRFRELLDRFRSSIPLLCYLGLILLSILRIRIPEEVLVTFRLIGQANIFLIMFMTGMLLDIRLDQRNLVSVAKILSARLALASAIALLFCLLPLEDAFRNALIIAVFSPVSGVIIAFAQQLDCDTKLTAMVSSVSIPVSLAAYMILLFLLA